MAEILKNSIHVVEISGMTHEGQGVGRIEGFTVFVEGALEGEYVEIKIIKIAKNYAVGKLIRIVKQSEARISPFCEFFKGCGGCSLQHMDYAEQLKFKTNLVKENIKRIGKQEDVIVHDTIGMGNPFNYRNKAQFPVALSKGTCAVGFYAKRSHDVIDVETCGIQNNISDKVREILRKFIKQNNLSIYDEISHKGLIRHIMVRTGFNTGEVMVVIVINGEDILERQQVIGSLVRNIPEISSIFLNINKSKSNVVLGEKNIKIYGKDTISEYIGKYKFNISPPSFFQVNPLQTEVLYEKAIEYAGLTGKETVFDLYCGIGTISLFLAERAKKVYGIEVIEDAVRDAKINADQNGVENVEFITGEAEKVVPEMYQRGIKADVVVVDPPRKGCDEVLLSTLVAMVPDRIVYVSCNPATLARDLKYLGDHGYRTVETQPVDMFPWTGHVECVVLMSRVEK
jgi:23S rRNA (uracil1939-C5)-methyltransferase